VYSEQLDLGGKLEVKERLADRELVAPLVLVDQEDGQVPLEVLVQQDNLDPRVHLDL